MQAVGANTYYAMTDSAGQYYLAVETGSTYTLSVVPPNALWEPCPVLPSVTVSQPNETVPAGDILVKKLADCPDLTITIATGQLRRCFNGFYSVNYCNEGTTLPKMPILWLHWTRYLALQFTTIPHTDLGNDQLRFDLGLLDVGECGSFKIYVNVSSNATLVKSIVRKPTFTRSVAAARTRRNDHGVTQSFRSTSTFGSKRYSD